MKRQRRLVVVRGSLQVRWEGGETVALITRVR